MSRVSRNLIVSALVILGAVVSLGAIVFDLVRTDDDITSRIVELATDDNRAMQHLGYLVNDIGARPADSYKALVAYRWTRDELRAFGLQNVHLELAGEIEGYFPDAEISERYRQLYQSMFDKEADLESVPIFNVVADLPGAELPYEYVIIGGHLDSTAHGDGATDNGTGVAAIMEAARLLVEAEVRPRRTVRFILFGGEEVGLVGSQSYVEDHPEMISATSAVYVMDHGSDYISGILATKPLEADLTRAFEPAAKLDPEMPFNLAQVDYLPRVDPNCGASAIRMTSSSKGEERRVVTGGCGTARGAEKSPATETAEAASSSGRSKATAAPCTSGTTDGKAATRRIVVAGPEGDLDSDEIDLESLGITPEMMVDMNGKVRKVAVMGSSDHAPFLAAGIPAFFLKQEGTPELAYPAHTGEDTADAVVAHYVEHSAAVLALGALGTANLDHMLSRDRLEAPASVESAESTQGNEISDCYPNSGHETGDSIQS